MKKLLVILLVLVTAFCFVACNPSDKKTAVENIYITNAPMITTNEPSEDDPPVIVITPGPTGTAKIEEQVIVDESSVKVTLKDIDMDSMYAPGIKLFVENFAEQDLVFSVYYASVNGYMNSANLSTTVPAGKKSYETIRLSKEDMDLCGIDVIADVQFQLYIYETNNYQPLFISDIITVKTSESEDFEYTYDDSGDVIYDKDGFRIITKGLMDDSDNGPKITFYIENNSDKDVTVSSKNVSINDFMVTDLLYANVLSGKRALVKTPILSEWDEVPDIGAIETITLSFVIRSTKNYKDTVETDPITIHF